MTSSPNSSNSCALQSRIATPASRNPHGYRTPRSNRARPANRQHPPPHLPLLRPDQAQVRTERSGPRILGISETPSGGTGPAGGRPLCLPHQGELPAHLRARSHRRRLSRWHLVSLRNPGSDRADHPGTPDRRTARRGLHVRALKHHEVLIGQKIEALRFAEARRLQLANQLFFGNLHALGRPQWQRLLVKLDDHDASARLQRFRQLGIVGRATIDVMQHVDGRAAYYPKLAKTLKPGGRIVVIEFYKKPLPLGPPESMKISEEELIGELQAAGFRKTKSFDFLPYQYFVVFERANM